MAPTRCRQAPGSRQEEARARSEPGTAGRPQRRVGEEGRERGRRSWGQQTGVQQKQRRQGHLRPSLGCKVTVAVEGQKKKQTLKTKNMVV